MAEAGLIAVQVASQFAQGLVENGQQREQARALDENARITETQGAYDALDALRRGRADAGIEITTLAAQGGLGGSVGDLLSANAVQREMEAANIRYQAASKGYGLRRDAEVARSNGRAAIFGSVLRAGATALKGASDSRNAGRLAGALNPDSGRVVQPMGTIPVPYLPVASKFDKFAGL